MPEFLYPYDLPDFIREDVNIQGKLITMRDVFRDAINYLAANYDLYGPTLAEYQTQLLRLDDNEGNIAANLLKIEANEVSIESLLLDVTDLQMNLPSQITIDQLQITINDYFTDLQTHIASPHNTGGSSGVYYNDTLPPEEELNDGDTWFDES